LVSIQDAGEQSNLPEPKNPRHVETSTGGSPGLAAKKLFLNPTETHQTDETEKENLCHKFERYGASESGSFGVVS
jgi:hypothetical protein